ncbi:hypothetical protein [Agathobacter rectalis]|uniref:hypothetical protein n=1 Tax=Agathobacter rectalis TaxID=39491 RepID=UPI00321BE8CD
MEIESKRQFVFVIVVGLGCPVKILKKKLLKILDGIKRRVIKMVVERRCINLYSDMNSWMDLVLLVNDEDFDKAKEVTEKAFDDFWNDPKVEEECWCYGDWVGWKLKEAGIKYNMYFRGKEDD